MLYTLALFYALMSMIQFARFGWGVSLAMLLGVILVVLYAIGARGYLNEASARAYFRIEEND